MSYAVSSQFLFPIKNKGHISRQTVYNKIKTVATRLYRADDIIADKKIRAQIRKFFAPRGTCRGDLAV